MSAKGLLCYLAANLLLRGSASVRVGDILEGPLGSVYRKLIAAAEAQEERLDRAREAARNMDDLEGEDFDDEDGQRDILTLAISSFDAPTALAFDIEHLEGTFSEQSHDGAYISILISPSVPVIALAAESIVRYDYTESDLVPYLLDIAGVEM